MSRRRRTTPRRRRPQQTARRRSARPKARPGRQRRPRARGAKAAGRSSGGRAARGAGAASRSASRRAESAAPAEPPLTPSTRVRRRRRTARLVLSAGSVLLGLALFACVREVPPERPSGGAATIAVEEPEVRILLVEEAEVLELTLEGPWSLDPDGGGAQAVPLESPGAVRIRYTAGARPGFVASATVDGALTSWGFPDARALEVRPGHSRHSLPQLAAAGPLGLDGRRYRGALRVTALPSGRVRAVNHVGVEDYLAGVIGHEMPLAWSDAALHAQAIASRTYAIANLKEGAAWDMTADTRSQVYRGVMAEDARARTMVEATRGLVVTHGGELVVTYFHSTCGGDTVPAEWVFPWHDQPSPPLSGATACTCQPSKYYRWTEEVDLGQQARELVLELPLASVEVAHHPRGGYVKSVALTDAGGEVLTLRGWDARRVFGLRSYAWEATLAEDGRRITFEGRGWGHGVGMCQFGAEGFSKQGLDAEGILTHFYPGTRVTALGY